MAVCNKARSWTLEAGRHVSARTAYFPFDSPRLMRRALGQTLPKVVVLLETELWPGLLWACKREDVPVLVVNGRMRSKSLAGYLALGGLFRQAAPPGSVVLWDVMGELDAAYARARAAFVGGSLRPLGGQNFLEPMAHGIAPVIGPHWSNFAWVGREAVDLGLVHEARDAKHATTLLLKNLQRPADPESVQKRFQAYLAERRGGTEQACRAVAEFLD
jgi:3-deoxy-D-manno-octulosonic-acid transferase